MITVKHCFLLPLLFAFPARPQSVAAATAQTAVQLISKTFKSNPALPKDQQLTGGGKWLVSSRWDGPVPADCGTGECFQVTYRTVAPAAECSWLVRFAAPGGEGEPQVLEENADAAKLTMRVAFARSAKEDIHGPAPTYPPIAAAAHVSGEVVAEVTVSAAGKVVGLSKITGPPMLQGAALDALRAATLDPMLLGGTSIAWHGRIHYGFVTHGPGLTQVFVRVDLAGEEPTTK